MKENVIIVNCKIASEAYQALSMLKRDAGNESYMISQAAIVKKEAGHLSLEDGFITDAATDDRSWTGGLIGSLVGILAGPLGVLLGGSVGMLIGDAVDSRKIDEKSTLLEKASECLADGETALMLLVKEEDETALPAKLKDIQMTITRLDAGEVAAEVEHAKGGELQTAD